MIDDGIMPPEHGEMVNLWRNRSLTFEAFAETDRRNGDRPMSATKTSVNKRVITAKSPWMENDCIG